MTDKEFWLIVKRALQMVVKAIERKYSSKEEMIDIHSDTVTVSKLPDLPDE